MEGHASLETKLTGASAVSGAATADSVRADLVFRISGDVLVVVVVVLRRNHCSGTRALCVVGGQSHAGT